MRFAVDKKMRWIAGRRLPSPMSGRSVTCLRYARFVLMGFLAVVLVGCTASRDVTTAPRGAIEQLLLSQSLERALSDLRVSMLKDARVTVEIEGLPPDLAYVRGVIAEHLGLQKMQLRQKKEEAQYIVKIIVHSYGTEQSRTVIGLPEAQGGFFPIAIPELAFYKEERQKGYARVSLAVYEASTEKLITALPWRAGSAYYDFYTVLFFITFPATDLVLPPTPDSGVEPRIARPTDIFAGDEAENSVTSATPVQ